MYRNYIGNKCRHSTIIIQLEVSHSILNNNYPILSRIDKNRALWKDLNTRRIKPTGEKSIQVFKVFTQILGNLLRTTK